MRNGALTSEQLTLVDDLYLAHAAAAGWNAMRAACKAATGVDLRIARPYGAYRSLIAQRVMYENRDDYGIGIAAPGHSTHGFGLAVDATLTSYNAARDWLLANCRRFGFAVPPANDRNHFVHTGTTPAGGYGTPLTEKEPEMTVIVQNTRTTVAALVDATTFRVLSKADVAVERRLWGAPYLQVSQAEWDTLQKARPSVEAQLTPDDLVHIANLIASKITVPTKGTITLTQ